MADSASVAYPPLPAALSGERFEFDSIAGRISAYVAGLGPPLLLIHTVNASASAVEIRTLHEHYKHSRTVFSIDLPRYGFSERSDRQYNSRLMTDAIVALVEQIHACCGTAPVDALAASLSCEFLARAAMERPTYFRKLALVSPTRFQRIASRRNPLGSTLALPMLHRAFTGPAGAARYFVASRGLR